MEDWQEYRVLILPRAARGLKDLAKKLRDKSAIKQLREAILDLRQDPLGKTQPLARELSAFRSLHVGRCRVIVKIDNSAVVVYVVAAGWHTSGDRDDIYSSLTRVIQGSGIDALATAEEFVDPDQKPDANLDGENKDS